MDSENDESRTRSRGLHTTMARVTPGGNHGYAPQVYPSPPGYPPYSPSTVAYPPSPSQTAAYPPSPSSERIGYPYFPPQTYPPVPNAYPPPPTYGGSSSLASMVCPSTQTTYLPPLQGYQTYPPPPSTIYPPPPQQSHRGQLDRQGSGYQYGLVPGGNPSAYGAYGGYPQAPGF